MNQSNKRIPPIVTPEDLDNRITFTSEESRVVLGVGPTKWHEIIKSGELPTIKIGKSRRATGQHLKAYIASKTQQVAC